MNRIYAIVCFAFLITLTGCSSSTNISAPALTAGPTSTPVSNTANSSASANNETAEPALGTSDEDFIKSMAMTSGSQIEIGKIAATKAADPELKKFAETMVTEHSQSLEELRELAAKLQVTIPDTKPRRSPIMDDLRKRTGADFDKLYVKIMDQTHEAIVMDYQSKAKDAKDQEVKAFAEKNLPVLRKHFEEIREIQKRIK